MRPCRISTITSRPRKRRHWSRVEDPDRYPELSDGVLNRLAYPPGRGRERNLRAEVHRLVKTLEDAHELRVVDGRILPPVKLDFDRD